MSDHNEHRGWNEGKPARDPVVAYWSSIFMAVGAVALAVAAGFADITSGQKMGFIGVMVGVFLVGCFSAVWLRADRRRGD